jgi:hypothetical protein
MKITDDICFTISSDLIDLFHHGENRFQRRLALAAPTLDKINSLIHKIPESNPLFLQHRIIEKLEDSEIVDSVQYDIIRNEDLMEFSRIEIIFKKNT